VLAFALTGANTTTKNTSTAKAVLNRCARLISQLKDAHDLVLLSLGLLVEQLQGNLSVENARFNICQYPLLGERINTGSSSSQCFNKIL
jgi:hypothetical protein